MLKVTGNYIVYIVVNCLFVPFRMFSFVSSVNEVFFERFYVFRS